MKKLLILLALLIPLKGFTADPTELNIRTHVGDAEFYLREGYFADHYQINYSLANTPIANPIVGSVGYRHAQSSRGNFSESRVLMDTQPLSYHSPIGHFEAKGRVEFRDFNGGSRKRDEWRGRLIFDYMTPSFMVASYSVNGWAKVQPRFSAKSKDDSRNQAGITVSHPEWPFSLSPFVETYRNEDFNHKYNMIGLNVKAYL